MLKKIQLLAKGEALKEGKNFSFSVDFIKEALDINKIYKGSFLVNSKTDNGSEIIYLSNNYRVKILQDNFTDKNKEIFWTVDTTNLSPKDTIEAKIIAFAEGQEMALPLSFDINWTKDNLIIYALKTKEDYYNLLCKNPETALRIFQNANFIKSPFMQDDYLQLMYQTLKKGVSVFVTIKEFFLKLGYDISNIVQVKTYKEDLHIDYFDTNEYNEDTLKDLYIDLLDDEELIEQISIFLIRAGLKNEVAFQFFKKSIIKRCNITKLYDNFLYATPKNYNKVFPKEVYIYYSKIKNMPYDLSWILYVNIVRNLSNQSDIFKLFEKQMLTLALDFINKNKIDDDIACLYDKVLNKDVITKEIANNLIYILRYFKIEVLSSDIKNVIIRYKEINGENKFSVRNGVCYATIFFDSFEVFFEDAYGNRFVNVKNRIRPMFYRPDLEQICYQLCTDINLLKLAKLRNIIQNNIHSDEELFYLIDISTELDLTTIMIDKIQKCVLYYINCYFEPLYIYKPKIIEYLDSLKDDKLNKELILLKFSIYLKSEEYEKAFKLLVKFNLKQFDIKLVEKLMLVICEEDTSKYNIEQLTYVCNYLMENKIEDNSIIQFLANNYDKDTPTMLYILQLSEKLNINSFIIAKKLLLKYLYINEITNIDYVFDVYLKNRPADEDTTLMNAYLTRSSIGYFLYERDFTPSAIEPLEEIIFENLDNLELIPKIYLFAIAKYLSKKDVINTDERRALIILSDKMLQDRIYFEWSKDLYKFIDMKEELANAEYIEYHAKNDEIPKAFIKIDDGKELEYELFNVYKNIYVRPILIFKNETIKYKIFNINNIEDGVLKEGTFSYDPVRNDTYVSPNNITSSFKYINEAIDLYNNKKYADLKNIIKEMIKREGMTKELFNI